MIQRSIKKELLEISKKMPAIAVLGPRQSGKTTLTKSTFKNHLYLSLEDRKIREFAKDDPHDFFKTHDNKHGLILDEIQEAPELLSYIQLYIDEYERPGYFVLTGSQNFLVNDAITQTLAGRISIFTLLPLSIKELKSENLLPKQIEELIFKGQYPRIYSSDLPPAKFYPSYIRTYIERDVRTLRNVTSLSTFQRFIGLCAGRIGQLLNISSLANDCGINVATAKSWISLLEASYIIFLLKPYHRNFGKRLIKTPKLYFYDTGLACSVLEIESASQVSSHYLRGGLVESFVISEFYKERCNRGLMPNFYFWRDKMGNEIDCLIASGDTAIPVEIKAGKSISRDWFKGLNYWYNLLETENKHGVVVYAGDDDQNRSAGRIVSWKSTDTVLPKIV